MPMIYFNVAGLSPFNHAVQEEVSTTLEQFSHLLYSDEGIRFYRETLQRCRKHLAEWLRVEDANHLAFVPNATTASALVLSRIHWESGDTLLTTTHENATILKEISVLQSHGVQIETLTPNSPVELENAIAQRLRTTHVRAILISHVSQIDGRIFPVERLSQLTQKSRTLLIVDGAQAVGHIPVDFHHWQPDAYFFPGHKWCAGPMGTGALIIGNRLTEQADREKPAWTDYELGTQNIGLIAGFAKACTIKQTSECQTEYLKGIREKVRQELEKTANLEVLEWEGPHSPGMLSFTGLDQQAAIRCQTKPDALIWKTFPLPHNPEQRGIRLSWSPDTAETAIKLLLTFFRNQH